MSIEIVITEQPAIELNLTENNINLNINPGGITSLSAVPDVVFNNLNDGDLIQFDAVDEVWRNASPAASTGDIDGGTFF